MMRRRVIVESPYAGDIDKNERYARAAMRDCLLRGEAPLASHLLYTQPGVLDDATPDERQLGIECGFEWAAVAHAQVFYKDLGWSPGMEEAWRWGLRLGLAQEIRYLFGIRL